MIATLHFEALMQQLISAPVLAIHQAIHFETDASIQGLVLYFPRSRRMESLTQLCMPVMHSLPQNTTTASLNWRHLQ